MSAASSKYECMSHKYVFFMKSLTVKVKLSSIHTWPKAYPSALFDQIVSISTFAEVF